MSSDLWPTAQAREAIKMESGERSAGVEIPVESATCVHDETVRAVTPGSLGCEECLVLGDRWVHLRLCRTCGHVGCCDDSPNRHANKHYQQTAHPIIEGYDPAEGWGWCYPDERFVELPDQTPQRGPIPQYL